MTTTQNNPEGSTKMTVSERRELTKQEARCLIRVVRAHDEGDAEAKARFLAKANEIRARLNAEIN